MAGPTVYDVVVPLLAGITTLIAVVVGGFSLYLVHIYRKFEDIPSPPRKSFFLGHVPNIREARKRTDLFAMILLEWCEELGETFVLIFLGKPLLVTLNSDAVKELLVTANFPKPYVTYKAISYVYGERFLGRGLATDVETEAWSKRRAALNPAFHREMLRTLINEFNDTSDQLMLLLSEKADGKTNITLLDSLNRATLDIIAKVAFDMDIGSINNPDSPFPSAMNKVLKGISATFKSEFRKLIPFLDRSFKTEVYEAIRLLRQTGKGVFEERMKAIAAGEVVPSDILSFVLQSKEADPTFDMETIVDDFVTLFMAGQETTANTLAFAIRELGRNPDILKRLREEVDSVIGEKPAITFEDVNKLEYSLLIIKETLRLYPPAPFTFRELTCDHNVGGYLVPKGTPIVLSTFLSSRCSRTAPSDALTFDPSRFELDSPRRPSTYTYFPFSLGPRSCIGITFAQIEARIVLAKLIQRFDFDLDPTQSFEIEENATLRPKDGTRVVLTLRNK